MQSEDAYRWRKQVLWGLALIVLGTVVLLDRLGHIDAQDYWHYAPLLLVIIGISQTIGYPSPREFSSGLWTAFTGLWLFAVFENAFGLTFRNSWPLFILMWGVKLVLDPFIARRFANNQMARRLENRHEK